MPSTLSDFSEWPIVSFTLAGAVDKTQSDVVVGGLQRALERGAPFATITDLTNMDPTTKATQDVYKAFLDRERDALRRYCRGGALIVTSQAMRLVINAFVLIARMPFPTRAFKTRNEAVVWCSEQLKSKQAA